MPWDVRYAKGVWLPQIGWWLDAQTGVPRAVVSHAHSDHIARHKEIVCTAPTALFLRERLGRRREEHVLAYGQTEQLTLDCAVTLHPAGHILGSAHVLLEHQEHGSLLYTGDFKLRPGLAAEPCASPRADLLIMETTFGLPKYVFPPAAAVAAQLVQFCRDALAGQTTPVLLAYSLGKTQELLQILGPSGLPVMLHPQAARLTDLYEQAGMKFAPYAEFDAVRYPGHVVICPPQDQLLHLIHPRRTAVATGWALDSSAKYRYGCDAAFPLSDHAGFDDLLAFVERVQPKRVLTLHGYAREFAATLRARGLEAWAVGRENQLDLAL
ncbi:MAG: MBL fold metallo-hydrolase RNA specificity domain-containing protein [Opitutales bacterium]